MSVLSDSPTNASHVGSFPPIGRRIRLMRVPFRRLVDASAPCLFLSVERLQDVRHALVLFGLFRNNVFFEGTLRTLNSQFRVLTWPFSNSAALDPLKGVTR